MRRVTRAPYFRNKVRVPGLEYLITLCDVFFSWQ